MADGSFPTLVSRDRNTNAQTNTVWVRISDDTNALALDGSGYITSNINGSVTVSATALDIRALVNTTDSILIYGNTAKDGSGTDYVPLLDADGKVIISNPGGTEYVEDAVAPQPSTGTTILVERDDALSAITPVEGDWSKLYCNANGALWMKHDGDITIADGGNTITVDGTVAISGTVAVTQSGTWNIDTVTTLTGITNDVNIADGGNTITVDATALDIRTITKATDSIQISKDTAANTELNPIYTYNVNTLVSGNEVCDYDTAASVAGDATDNHDYSITGTFLLKQVAFSSSGGGKFEVQVGPTGALVSKFVGFVPKHGGTERIEFEPAIEVPDTSTGIVRVIRTNREGSAQDVYSTIIGSQIA